MYNQKIIICGGYGNNNLGDDAQLLNNCEIFQENKIENIKIISHREYIGSLCGYPTIGSFRNDFTNNKDHIFLLNKFKNIISEQNISSETTNIINEIKTCDILFMSGSGTLNTRNYYGMLLALIPIAIAIKHKKRVVLSGQGFAPMCNKELEQILSSYLNRCELISTREFSQGYRILNQLQINPNIISVDIDDAFTLSETPMDINIPQPAIGINVSYYLTPNLYSFFSELADKLKEEGYYPIFNYFYHKDKPAIEKCTTKYPIVGFNNPKEAKWFFSKCVATIGMRYHSSILSVGAKTPNINIYVSEYQRNKFNAINEKEEVIPYFNGTNVTISQILNKLKKLKKTTVENLYKDWSLRANFAAKYVCNIIKNNTLSFDVLNLIKKRRSVRQFQSNQIPNIDLYDLVDAGIHAPSGSNTQCYRFKIITDKKDIEFLANNKIKIVNNATAIILVVADLSICAYLQGNRKDVFDKLPYQDCGMAMQNICILAEAKGIAQCVIHLSEKWSTNSIIKSYFNLQPHHELQGMILLGYPNETINIETATHAGKPIKRNTIEDYLL